MPGQSHAYFPRISFLTRLYVGSTSVVSRISLIYPTLVLHSSSTHRSVTPRSSNPRSPKIVRKLTRRNSGHQVIYRNSGNVGIYKRHHIIYPNLNKTLLISKYCPQLARGTAVEDCTMMGTSHPEYSGRP